MPSSVLAIWIPKTLMSLTQVTSIGSLAGMRNASGALQGAGIQGVPLAQGRRALGWTPNTFCRAAAAGGGLGAWC